MTLSSSLITLYAFKCVLYLAMAYLSFAAARFLKAEALRRKVDREQLAHADKVVFQIGNDNSRLRQALSDICKVYAACEHKDPELKATTMYDLACKAFLKRE